MVIRRRAMSSPAIAAMVRSLRYLLIESMQLPHQWGERRPHAGRNRLVAFRQDDRRQFAGVFEPLRCDHPHLGQMPANCVDQLRALRHQHFARLVMHERRLVLVIAHVLILDGVGIG